MKDKKIWITWERHRRTRELATALDDVQLFEIESSAPRFIRYIKLLTKTVFILLRERPKLVIIQSPSNILALFMVTLGRLYTDKIIIDAHNGGVRPFGDKLKYLMPVFAFIHKKADLVIVTNQALAEVIKINKGKSYILEDKLPHLYCNQRTQLAGDYNLVSICTFEPDEPFQEIMKAAQLIDQNIKIYITGNYAKTDAQIIKNASSNIIFTGYIPDGEYITLLASADAIIDLTNEPDCLVCGAYEAISLEKPLLLTDEPSLKSFFTKGVVFTENKATQIAEAIIKVISQQDTYQNEIHLLKCELSLRMEGKINELNGIFDEMIAS